MGDKAELVTVTILGRPVSFKQFNDTQVVLIHRMRQMLTSSLAQFPDDADSAAELKPEQQRAMDSGLDVTARFLDMIGFMVVSDEDRDWLTMQMLAGNLDLEGVAKVATDMVPADKQPKKATKRAIRAR